jgi:hypothetical protein
MAGPWRRFWHVMTALLSLVALVLANPPGAPDVVQQRHAYYARHYAGENGPFPSKSAALDAGLAVLRLRATAEDWGCEWLILISRDRYGRWWHTSPKTGSEVAPNQCEVTYSSAEIPRPGSQLFATAHTHPRGDLFPDPRPDPPDNRNDHEMFVLRSDGGVWRFAPRSFTPVRYVSGAGRTTGRRCSRNGSWPGS